MSLRPPKSPAPLQDERQFASREVSKWKRLISAMVVKGHAGDVSAPPACFNEVKQPVFRLQSATEL